VPLEPMQDGGRDEGTRGHDQRAAPGLVVAEQAAAAPGQPAVDRPLEPAQPVEAQDRGVQRRGAKDGQEEPARAHGAHKSGPTDGTPSAARAEDRLIFRSRRIPVAAFATALTLGLATAAYAAFNAPEPVDPDRRIGDVRYRVLAADAAGRATLLSVQNSPQRLPALCPRGSRLAARRARHRAS